MKIKPLAVATAFSEDQSLLLLSMIDNHSITVDKYYIQYHVGSYFTFTLPEGLCTMASRNRPSQAICISADHLMIATSVFVEDSSPTLNNIFIFRGPKHYSGAFGFAGQGVSHMKFSDSAELLVAVSEKGDIKVFKVPTYPSDPLEFTRNATQDLEVVAEFGSQGRIFRVEFSEDGRSLQTNLGRVNLFPVPGLIMSPVFPGLYLDDQWICMHGRRLVHLPPEYRPDTSLEEYPFPYNTAIVFQDPCVWIKTKSRGFIKIELDEKLIHRLTCDGELV